MLLRTLKHDFARDENFYHFGKLCQDPEELSGRLAVVGHVFLDEGHQGCQDSVDVIALGLSVELLVVVESALNLEKQQPSSE